MGKAHETFHHRVSLSVLPSEISISSLMVDSVLCETTKGYTQSNGRLKTNDLAKVCKPFKAFRKEQDRARALRDLIVSIPDDEELDSHFRMFNRPEILDLINIEGDIEHPVPLGMTLLRKVPEFRKLAVRAGFKLLFA